MERHECIKTRRSGRARRGSRGRDHEGSRHQRHASLRRWRAARGATSQRAAARRALPDADLAIRARRRRTLAAEAAAAALMREEWGPPGWTSALTRGLARGLRSALFSPSARPVSPGEKTATDSLDAVAEAKGLLPAAQADVVVNHPVTPARPPPLTLEGDFGAPPANPTPTPISDAARALRAPRPVLDQRHYVRDLARRATRSSCSVYLDCGEDAGGCRLAATRMSFNDDVRADSAQHGTMNAGCSVDNSKLAKDAEQGALRAGELR